jgi:hypothetical protein
MVKAVHVPIWKLIMIDMEACHFHHSVTRLFLKADLSAACGGSIKGFTLLKKQKQDRDEQYPFHLWTQARFSLSDLI